MLDSSGGQLIKKPYLETRNEGGQDSRKSSGHVHGNSTDLRRGATGGGLPDVLQPTTSST